MPKLSFWTLISLFNPHLGDKWVHTFPKHLNPKVKTIAWLEFELAYYDNAIQRVSHYATGILNINKQTKKTNIWLIVIIIIMIIIITIVLFDCYEVWFGLVLMSDASVDIQKILRYYF